MFPYFSSFYISQKLSENLNYELEGTQASESEVKLDVVNYPESESISGIL